ncbi:PAS domain-containing protein [Hymenobacter sp. UYP22]|uniref:PAS domain-containing sensor histidine kinase n=1 Tax=Hymenobacter sp. UYP22 TaxID=3156348 RepID=UPI003394F5C3
MPAGFANSVRSLPASLLPALLENSLAGVGYFLPLTDEAGAVHDFTIDYLNPAAEHLLGPATPGLALSQWLPANQAAGILELLQAAYAHTQLVERVVGLPLPGGSISLRATAQQVGEGMLLNCLPVSEAVLAAAQEARQQSEARELAAYAEANRQREHLYHLLEQAPAMICVFDGPDHVFQFVNPAYQALVGARPLVGLPIAVAMPELKGQPIFALLDQVYQTGETFSAHEMLVQLDHANEGRTDLEQRYYNFIYQARRSQQEEISGIYVFAYDVTAQVEARQQIERQNELLEVRVAEGIRAAEAQREAQQADLRRIFEQTPVAIAILRGPELVIELANAAIGEIWGRPPANTLGQPYFQALPDTAGQGFENILAGVMRTGQPYSINEAPVTINRAHTGQSRQAYVDFTFQPLQDEAGHTTSLIAVGYEVTEQVGIRQQQQKQQNLLHSLFLEVPAPIAILAGPTFIYQLVNPAYQLIFPGRSLLNRPLLEALPELTDTPIPALLHHVYTTGKTYMAREMPLEVARVEGQPLETVYFTFTYQARRNELDQIDGVLVFAYDETEQVRARLSMQANQQQTQQLADELSNTNAQLTRANADLDTFVYMASHDLKAPITNIDGLLQALRHELTQPAAEADTETVLRLMQDSVQRFQRTIKYLTEVSRWQNVQDQPITHVSLPDVVADVCRDLAPLLAVTGGQVLLSPDSCTQLLFAEKHLRSLLYNLLSNGLKYRSPERAPLVQVRCHFNQEEAFVLEVEDNGLGLTPEQQQRVFGMFQRLHDHVEGSGIGLYLAKQVVEKTGGQLSVTSQVGVGSIFRAVLPQPIVKAERSH